LIARDIIRRIDGSADEQQASEGLTLPEARA
jgi:hypothetical protein